MDEEKAEKIAKMLGAFNSGGNIWLVIVRQKKHIAVISEETVSAPIQAETHSLKGNCQLSQFPFMMNEETAFFCKGRKRGL